MFLLLASGQVFAQQYDKGLYKWKVKEGELTLVAAKMVRPGLIPSSYFEYSFYLKATDGSVYGVPFLKTSDAGGDYDTSVIASGDGENIWADADVVQKKGDLFIYCAGEDSVEKYGTGPIEVKIYKFIRGKGDDWMFGFKLEKQIKYGSEKKLTVPAAIKKAEN